MSILEKIKACIAEKMVKRSVPKMIADRVASEYVNNDITATEFNEIHKKRMTLEYSNTTLSINKVNTSPKASRARLMSLTTRNISNRA